ENSLRSSRLLSPTGPNHFAFEIPGPVSDTVRPSTEAGEFTQMFQGPLAAKPRPLPGKVPDHTPGKASAPFAPGELYCPVQVSRRHGEARRSRNSTPRTERSRGLLSDVRYTGHLPPEISGSRRPAPAEPQPSPLQFDQDRSTSRPQA